MVEGVIGTALVSGDTIVLSLTPTGAQIMICCAWYSGIFGFDVASTSAAFSGTNAITSGITTTAPGDLVLGMFSATMNTATIPAISTPGAGYTNQTGVGSTSGA